MFVKNASLEGMNSVFEVMTTIVLMKIKIFRDVTLCRWIESLLCFELLSAYIFRIKQSKKQWKGLHLCVSVQ